MWESKKGGKTMNLLRDLWWGFGNGEGNRDGGQASGASKDWVHASQVSKKELSSGIPKSPAMSYVQAVSSSSSGDHPPANRVTAKKNSKNVISDLWSGGGNLSSIKRPRSPKSLTCNRCFRTSHSTVECRHQVVCLSCSCVEHMAARCPVEPCRNPHRKWLHIRSKRMLNE